jgi:hypothetical protein
MTTQRERDARAEVVLRRRATRDKSGRHGARLYVDDASERILRTLLVIARSGRAGIGVPTLIAESGRTKATLYRDLHTIRAAGWPLEVVGVPGAPVLYRITGIRLTGREKSSAR